jgi:hypothetical protein
MPQWLHSYAQVCMRSAYAWTNGDQSISLISSQDIVIVPRPLEEL